jgi:hypothetical protein
MWCLETLIQINQEAAKGGDHRDVYARCGIQTGDGSATVEISDDPNTVENDEPQAIAA